MAFLNDAARQTQVYIIIDAGGELVGDSDAGNEHLRHILENPRLYLLQIGRLSYHRLLIKCEAIIIASKLTADRPFARKGLLLGTNCTMPTTCHCLIFFQAVVGCIH